ncbi:MAG: cysteine hydrolase [Nitrososphaerota archaeon]|nr:cysteine hydrolase [Nitrososphaerota archaeon]MDG7051943.1 cysteine hydrolase [Nitrososphaerota archaeon]
MMQQATDFIRGKTSGLIVWDMQEALVNFSFNKVDLLKSVGQLISEARALSIPIFYTKITPLPDRFESSARRISMRRGKFEPGDIVREIYPLSNDIVINKNTASLFVGTNFEMMARNASLTSLVFTGIATEIGVESSARHAQNLGFIPVIAKEAVSSSDREAHERSLLNMQKLFPVLTNDEIIRYWKQV